MLIGIDGNEANVTSRVGSGQYAYELLRQFQTASNYHVIPAKAGINSDKRQILDQVENDKLEFIVYLKEQPLPDLPKETVNFNYKVFGPKKLWTQFALPINLSFGKKPDVFFSTAHYGPRFSPVPYVVTIHDLSYLHFPELFKKNDLYQLTNWSKYSISNSKHIIVPSNSTKDDIVKNYKIKSSKITVTYEGYDRSRFKPQPKSTIEEIKAKYKIKGNYIVYVGTLQPRKNIERLIEAFAKITETITLGDRSNIKSSIKKARGTRGTFTFREFENKLSFTRDTLTLVIVGKKGWMYDQILAKAKKLGVEEHVIFTDFVPDSDLPAVISGADVYVNPSLWEGFGIPVIEAQACGIPVVVANTSSLPEIVNPSQVIPALRFVQSKLAGIKKKILDRATGHEQSRMVENDSQSSGVLVDPLSVDSIASGIQKVLTDEKTRSGLVKKGFANIKRFSWEKCAAQTLETLEKVASNRTP